MSFGLTAANLPDKIKRLMSPEDRKSLGKAGMTAEEALLAAKVRIEKDLQNVVEGWLGTKGITVLRARMDKKTTNKRGQPDLLFVVKPPVSGSWQGPHPLVYPCAWECKMPGEELEEEQVKMAARLTADGWHWMIITSLDDAIAELRTMGL